jgi:hypothetical protein
MDAYLGASRALWQTYRAREAARQRFIAEVRQKAALRKAVTDPKRLAVADQALEEGDLDLACDIYTRLAVSFPKTAITEAAKRRVARLQQEARQELKEVDAMLAGPTSAARSIRALTPIGSGKQWEDRVTKAFQEYDRLGRKYRRLPVVGDEIARRAASQRRRPAYAAVLSEGQARALWELGQQYEEQGHPCCAYLVYEEAAKLVPAPSAQLAKKRFTEMSRDPQIVASSKTCRQLQWCHEAYLRAERLAEANPAGARRVFNQIVRRAPQDSEVYRSALERIKALN